MEAIAENKKGSYVVGGEQAGQPQYFPLEIKRGEEGALWSAWKPSWSDIFWMMMGMPIRLGILADRQPPIFLKVGK